MSSERKQILSMLAEGKITADDAERLLDALGEETDFAELSEAPAAAPNGKPKFLHIQVHESGHGGRHGENVNIKVPIFLLKAGLKLGGLVPVKARAKVASHLGGMGLDLDLSKLDAGNIDGLLQALGENSIDIVSDKEKVRIFCR